ncbi:hypothetical protein M441DRAFT_145078, partial [Trichoderma asperellum CBS 433.97]
MAARKKKRVTKPPVATPRERISNYFLTKEEFGSTTDGPQEEHGSTIDGPQYEAEMMDVDSDKESGEKTVWSRQETRGSDKESGEKTIGSRQETGGSENESIRVSLGVSTQKSESNQRTATQRSLGNPPAASLEKEEEGSVKLEELDDEDAVPVQGDTCDNDWAAEEDIDESDSEPIEMDPIDTLVDDEYIALEDDEGEGDDVVPVENVMENDNDSSEASQKRPRTQTAEVDAAQWVKECDKAYAVDENDKDVRQFEAYLAHIIYIIYRWAEDL